MRTINKGLQFYNLKPHVGFLTWGIGKKGFKGLEMRSVNVPKMKQPDIIRVVSELSGYSQKECREVVENYLHVVRECLLSGREVCLQKLGTFTLKYRPYKPPRMMPNVNYDGEERLVKERLEHNIPKFLVSQQLRSEMMESTWGNPIFKPDNVDESDEEEE